MSKENMHLFADTSVVDSTHRNKNDSLFKLSLYGREVSYKGNSYFIHSVRESGAFYSAFATRNVAVELHSFDDRASWGYVDINEVEFFLADDNPNTLSYKDFKSIAPLESLIDNIFEGTFTKKDLYFYNDKEYSCYVDYSSKFPSNTSCHDVLQRRMEPSGCKQRRRVQSGSVYGTTQ
jgi:hypothetical protein